jgi:exportin-T
VRYNILSILSDSIGLLKHDAQSLGLVKAAVMGYVQQAYGPTAQSADPTFIQNKMAAVLTELFAIMYPSAWQSFIDDLLVLADHGQNTRGTLVTLKVLDSIHDEIADTLISRSQDDTKRNNILKDLVRERDGPRIAGLWQELMSKWQHMDPVTAEMCMSNISKWVSWSDISLVASPPILDGLLEMAGQQDVGAGSFQGSVRDEAIATFTEIASKKMRPHEKIELINALRLVVVVDGLVNSPALSANRNTPRYDTDLAELVAKLINNMVKDIVGVLDSDAADQTKQEANSLLKTFVVYLLRFFADEYDEVCSTVVEGLSLVLAYFRKLKKSKPEAISEYSSLLPTILEAIIEKMRYDETAIWNADADDPDEGEFLDLRRRLANLQTQILAVDEVMVIDAVSTLVQQTFRRVADKSTVSWQDLDLALQELYHFGDFTGKKTIGSSQQVTEQLRAMTMEMMSSGMFCLRRLLADFTGVGLYEHPVIQLQFMENAVRYAKYLETNTQWIPMALDAFVRHAHSDNFRVKTRSWYLLQRFVRLLRGHLGEVSQTLVQALGDLLAINAVLPAEDDEDLDSEATSGYDDVLFGSQIYIFEAIGVMASSTTLPLETKLLFIHSVIDPIFQDMDSHINPAKSGSERSILQIHHDIMALGSLSHGFSGWVATKETAAQPAEITEEFVRCTEAILLALQSLNSSIRIRQASRFAFSRLMPTTGTRVLPQLPRWIEGLLSPTSTKDEITYFLPLLGQLVHTFKAEIASVLDAILSPLVQKVFEHLSEPVSGGFDAMQVGELRREFLNFILSCLNNDLGGVLVSSSTFPTSTDPANVTDNQGVFDNIIAAMEHFARDASDIDTARLTFQTLTRIMVAWGGPDVAPLTAANGPPPNSPTGARGPASAPAIPGFDAFAISRLSPLSWAIPAADSFRAGDPGGRQLVHEIAGLQQEIYRKTGEVYVEALRRELGGMGLGLADVEVYVQKLRGDPKGFREFLAKFLGRAG